MEDFIDKHYKTITLHLSTAFIVVYFDEISSFVDKMIHELKDTPTVSINKDEKITFEL